MIKLQSPELVSGGVERFAAVALFAGIIAVGASFIKHIFSTSKKSKEK